MDIFLTRKEFKMNKKILAILIKKKPTHPSENPEGESALLLRFFADWL